MNIENLIRNRKATKVALIVILVLTLAMATGCGKKKNKTPTPTTPSATVTKEETTPEVVEPTESAPVETVEPTETALETEDIKNIDLSKYSNIFECIEDLGNYDTLMIIVDSGEEKEILLDGDSYTYNEGDKLILNRSPQNSNLKAGYLKTFDGEYEISYTDDFYFLSPIKIEGEYTIVFVYNDGTEEEMTITLD